MQLADIFDLLGAHVPVLVVLCFRDMADAISNVGERIISFPENIELIIGYQAYTRRVSIGYEYKNTTEIISQIS